MKKVSKANSSLLFYVRMTGQPTLDENRY